MVNRLQLYKLATRFFSDESLTEKAVLNGFSSFLDYFTQIAVVFLVTPLMVAGLGSYYYGVWQTLNRLVGYLSPAIGKPTQTLRWTLANQKFSNDFDQKRRHVGSALLVWMFFLPLFVVGGVLLTWFVPYWLKTPPSSVLQVRLVTILLVINLVVLNLTALPRSVLEGENLGYKRMGLAALLTILGGITTWLVLVLKQGIVGVAVVALLVTVVSGVFYLGIVRSNVTWFGVKRPEHHEMRSFFNLSIWFVAWDIILKLMAISDVVILAFFNSMESVTSFSLTKQAPETIISFVAIVVFGIVPGLGSIIGSGQIKRAAQLRGELMALTWLMLTVLGAVILIWNQTFIHLWVGDKHYAGPLENLLIILIIYQLSFIKNDANIIDLTLRLEYKVCIGALSVLVAIALSLMFVSVYDLGIVGLCLGLLLGRLILSLAYPILVGHFLDTYLPAQIKSSIRPVAATIFIFGVSFLLNSLEIEGYFSGLLGWLLFLILVSLTTVALFLISFYSGLSTNQRVIILKRLRHLASRFSV